MWSRPGEEQSNLILYFIIYYEFKAKGKEEIIMGTIMDLSYFSSLNYF